MSQKRTLPWDDATATGTPKRDKHPRTSQAGSSSRNTASKSLLSSSQPFVSAGGWATLTKEQLEQLELVDLTQKPGEYCWSLVGTIATEIVGVLNYRGYASPGEHVVVMREPKICTPVFIYDVEDHRIGHLTNDMGCKLEKYIVSRLIAFIIILRIHRIKQLTYNLRRDRMS